VDLAPHQSRNVSGWRLVGGLRGLALLRLEKEVPVWPGLRALIKARSSTASIATSVTSNLAVFWKIPAIAE